MPKEDPVGEEEDEERIILGFTRKQRYKFYAWGALAIVLGLERKSEGSSGWWLSHRTSRLAVQVAVVVAGAALAVLFPGGIDERL